ncbi:P-type conjugative transfer ATPase TrbB [Acidithiobacillus sp.]|uniref:P-type conjugative transfer ATPase TrbB n=1 Tax=Acidithiobacillus sp. TaxID=1872118 RepID=UPI003D0198E0
MEDVTTSEMRRRQIAKLRRELGPTILEALDDPLVVEVMLNPDGKLWVDKVGQEMTCIGEMDPLTADSMISTLATLSRKQITESNPAIHTSLPLHGERFAGLMPPAVDAVTFAIRKKAARIFTLDEYVERGIMTPEIADALREATIAHKNILVAGGTGSGKSTLTNAILHALAQAIGNSERILIIEDVAELQCAVPNTVFMRATEFRTQNELLFDAMRLRPDRIMLGEVRDKAAHTLLKAWNTGHPGGICTIHADTAESTLERLDDLCMEAGVPSQMSAIRRAIHMVVYIEKDVDGTRRVLPPFYPGGK